MSTGRSMRNPLKLDWRSESYLNEIIHWVTRSGKDVITLALIEDADVSHKTLALLKISLETAFPDKKFVFKEVPFCSKYSAHEHHSKNISCAPCDFFLDPKILNDLDLKSDIVLNIYTLHEFAAGTSLEKVFLAIENIRKYILNKNGLLLLVDGIQPYNNEDRNLPIHVMTKDILLGRVLEVMSFPEYAYVPIKLDGISKHLTRGDTLSLTVEQLTTVIFSSQYILNAIFENDAFVKKLQTVSKRLKLPSHEKLVEILATDKLLRSKLKIYFKEEEMARIDNLNSFGTLSLFLDNWQNYERFKKIFYFSYNDWSHIMHSLGFNQVKISLIENEDINMVVDLLLEPLKRDTFIYGAVKRGVPFGHCIVSAF